MTIQASALELRAGSRLLLSGAAFRVGPGDRIGLVGRNGAGKTTLTRVLAGEKEPASGSVTTSGTIGYLPQDPRDVNLDELARDRILSARGLDVAMRRMRQMEDRMATTEGAEQDRSMRRYVNAEAEFSAGGGYAAESEAAAISASLGLPGRVMEQTLGTLSGGQRRRVELS